MGFEAKHLTLSEINGMSPSAMVVMLYDGAIDALEAAVEALERGDIEARCNWVTVASEMIATLYLCLDTEKGGEIGENLGLLYSFILGRLHRINVYNDAAVAQETIRLLQPLRASWHDLDRQIASPRVASL
jgi:flagellar protein FliS